MHKLGSGLLFIQGITGSGYEETKPVINVSIQAKVVAVLCLTPQSNPFQKDMEMYIKIDSVHKTNN